MKSRPLLEKVNLTTFETPDLVSRIESIQSNIALHDQAVIDYLEIRSSDHHFRKRIKQTLSKFREPPGPEPDGLSATAFFELINAIKKSLKLKSIGLALEVYCELHKLPLEKASSFEDKYRRGRESTAKKKGG